MKPKHKHTSEPWRWDGLSLMGRDGSVVLDIGVGADGGSGPEPGDADLIAASPNLLETLWLAASGGVEKGVSVCLWCRNPPSEHEENCRIATSIAKAEGR